MNGRQQARHYQRGVALALVVWFIAGMSLLVAGIVSHGRLDTRMTQLHLARAKSISAGDGAIHLAMAARQRGYESSGSGPLISESVHRLGEIDVRVRLYPANGLLDLNEAPGATMAALFAFAGDVDAKSAKIIADNVVKWRQPQVGQQRSRLVRRDFYALEDLLRIEGINRQLLDAIRDYVVVGEWAEGTMDWSGSPQAILPLLETLNPERVNSIMGRRQNMMRTGTVTGGQRTTRAVDPVRVFRADALITYGGRQWLRRRWLTLESSRKSSLPWRVVRTEPPRVISG